MEPFFFVMVATFGLLYVLFIHPQQRRVRAHQQLVASLDEGDEVVLTAGIYGRITRLGSEDLDLEVAPGVELLVARQAVLRRVEHPVGGTDGEAGDARIDRELVDDNNAVRERGDDHALGSSGND
jgi:preprotein translocase subunit YajC